MDIIFNEPAWFTILSHKFKWRLITHTLYCRFFFVSSPLIYLKWQNWLVGCGMADDDSMTGQQRQYNGRRKKERMKKIKFSQMTWVQFVDCHRDHMHLRGKHIYRENSVIRQNALQNYGHTKRLPSNVEHCHIAWFTDLYTQIIYGDWYCHS